MKDSLQRLLQKGCYRQAAAILSEKLKGDFTAKDLNMLGVCEAKLGLYDDALRHFEMASDLAPKDPAPLNNMGNVLFLKGDHQGAIGCYYRALREKIWAEEPRHNLVLCHLRLGSVETALTIYRDSMPKLMSPLYLAFWAAIVLVVYVFLKG